MSMLRCGFICLLQGAMFDGLGFPRLNISSEVNWKDLVHRPAVINPVTVTGGTLLRGGLGLVVCRIML